MRIFRLLFLLALLTGCSVLVVPSDVSQPVIVLRLGGGAPSAPTLLSTAALPSVTPTPPPSPTNAPTEVLTTPTREAPEFNSAAEYTTRIRTTRANIRKGPGIEYGIMGQVESGEEIIVNRDQVYIWTERVEAEFRSWVSITINSNRQYTGGWIWVCLLQQTPVEADCPN